jgi:TATA-box binding protein (TBP) (component of TFIID and TFIIIB)
MNLKNVKYLNRFRRLPYPKNEMLIVGSGTMALLGLKKNNDIDIWASENVLRKVARNKNFIAKKSKLDGSILYETKV